MKNRDFKGNFRHVVEGWKEKSVGEGHLWRIIPIRNAHESRGGCLTSTNRNTKLEEAFKFTEEALWGLQRTALARIVGSSRGSQNEKEN